MSIVRFASSAIVAALLASSALAAEPEDTMVITLKNGEVTIALRPDLAFRWSPQARLSRRIGEDQGWIPVWRFFGIVLVAGSLLVCSFNGVMPLTDF